MEEQDKAQTQLIAAVRLTMLTWTVVVLFPHLTELARKFLWRVSEGAGGLSGRPEGFLVSVRAFSPQVAGEMRRLVSQSWTDQRRPDRAVMTIYREAAQLVGAAVEKPPITIEECDFEIRTYNCLKKAHVDTVEQLARMTVGQLLEIRNLGARSLGEIKDKLAELGLTLAEDPT